MEFRKTRIIEMLLKADRVPGPDPGARRGLDHPENRGGRGIVFQAPGPAVRIDPDHLLVGADKDDVDRIGDAAHPERYFPRFLEHEQRCLIAPQLAKTL